MCSASVLDRGGRTRLDDDWQRWSMFTVDVAARPTSAADASLLLLPSVPKVQEGEPLEEVC